MTFRYRATASQLFYPLPRRDIFHIPACAMELLYILEDPVRVQTCLRNIFEMTFDGMERAKQRERFEKLCQVYPDIGRLYDPTMLPDMEPGHRAFAVNSIFGLRLLELALYFQQDNQRIARCDYC